MTGDAVHRSSFVGGNKVSGFLSEQSRSFGHQLGGPGLRAIAKILRKEEV